MENPTPDYQQLMQMWFDFAAKMAAATAKVSTDAAPADGSRQLRDMYLQNLGEQTDKFMRSPQFLKMMKDSTEAAVALRRQTNELLTQAHHAVGGLARSDMDSLLMAIRRCETRVLDRLDELEARLAQVERGSADTNGHKSKTASKSK